MKVTLAQASLSEADVLELRGNGYSDAAISDAVQVIAYFNYVTRVADAIGVDDEPEWGRREPSNT
jgi:alkylhydroperoxidase family enzyme